MSLFFRVRKSFCKRGLSDDFSINASFCGSWKLDDVGGILGRMSLSLVSSKAEPTV